MPLRVVARNEAIQPSTSLPEVFVEALHHQVDGAAVGAADEAAVAVAADRERQAGVVVVVERAETEVSCNLESKSLRDPLDGEVAKLLKIRFIHFSHFSIV